MSPTPGSATAKPNRYSWPATQANWRAMKASAPLLWSSEYPLYSDAHITGQIDKGFGPYKLLNAIRIGEDHEAHLHPSVILRMDWHVPRGELAPRLGRSDAEPYHAGSPEDEVAALVGLCLGARMKAGAPTRHFDPGEDPKGRPSAGGFKSIPQIGSSRSRGWLLPWARGTQSLDAVLDSPLQSLPELDRGVAAAVVKAARLHQEALWIAEGAPELAWLLLVTAAETAASFWRQASVVPLEWLKQRKPKLCKRFKEEGQESLLNFLSEQLANLVGSTAQFRGFLETFCPDSPASRPQKCYQHSWDRRDLRKSFNTIYGKRSDFVHSGIPFPAMMCEPPYRDQKDRRRYAEIPLGTAMTAAGGAWTKEDAPMQLHIFEYIVRGALLKFWKWCLPAVPYLNTSTEDDLRRIPGLGASLSKGIIARRSTAGPFEQLEDITTIPGIGRKTFNAVKAHFAKR